MNSDSDPSPNGSKPYFLLKPIIAVKKRGSQSDLTITSYNMEDHTKVCELFLGKIDDDLQEDAG